MGVMLLETPVFFASVYIALEGVQVISEVCCGEVISPHIDSFKVLYYF
jgi:hypothetical protein